MDFRKPDPNDRRRVDAETQRNRDAEIARLRAAGVPYRAIAGPFGMSLGAVQKAVARAAKRAQKLADAMATGEPGNVVAVIDDEMTVEDIQTTEDIEKLNELELYRCRHLAPDSPQRAVLSQCQPSPAWLAAHAPRPPTVYPITDDGPSWHGRCDRTMSNDSGPDAADDDW
jgi:hypothetical protein